VHARLKDVDASGIVTPLMVIAAMKVRPWSQFWAKTRDNASGTCACAWTVWWCLVRAWQCLGRAEQWVASVALDKMSRCPWVARWHLGHARMAILGLRHSLYVHDGAHGVCARFKWS
jgi:hypothetical protein